MKPQQPTRTPPVCPYCHKQAQFFASSKRFYHGRNYGPLWACTDCNAWVGCHKGTTKPLGRLADAELRQAKVLAHAAFDPVWGKDRTRRRAAYSWLAEKLGIPREECHIGMFDVPTCQRVIEVCTERREAEVGA
jgi:hypothetical protein